MMSKENKNILIISHNPLSRVNNNGKTLVSIFEGVPKENIYQVYLTSDVPDYSNECHYLQLNEKQIIGSFLKAKNICCQEIKAISNKVSSAAIKQRSMAINTKRLLREGIWKIAIWKSRLKEWLKDKSFDIVFFMAGDGMFAYDVYRYIMKNISAKGCLFFTDDYILGKTSLSPVALLRRVLLKKKIKKTLKITKELYVISDEMKEAYKEIFHFDGCVIRNFSVERIKSESNVQKENSDGLVMVYAGGLHYNRWKVLSRIAHTLSEINCSGETKCFLKIYSSQNISKEIIDAVTVDGVSSFMGGVAASQIAEIYSGADILVHVESFDKKAIASTKYSFSTKIPEYLSAEKCILAVGPAEVASLKYLSDIACTVNNDADFYLELSKLISDKEYRELIKNQCKGQYEKDFSRENQKECLRRILSD
ncbi:MAG: hypothetical protein IKT70_08435 [Clostridia bacterium]|nr:hypothetical protein [Clostridia bacterium]